MYVGTTIMCNVLYVEVADIHHTDMIAVYHSHMCDRHFQFHSYILRD